MDNWKQAKRWDEICYQNYQLGISNVVAKLREDHVEMVWVFATMSNKCSCEKRLGSCLMK